jgi:hypothetical protein
MKYIVTEQQYNEVIYKRRYNQIKNLIDGLASNPDMYYDEDEFYDDIKDLVYKNVFLGNRQGLHWDEINKDDLMSFIDDYFQEYIKDIYRENI